MNQDIIRDDPDSKAEHFTEKLCSNIRKLLKRNNLTQHDLAEKIGCSDSTFSKSINEIRPFRPYELKCLVDCFGITYDELFTGIAPENKEIHNNIKLDNYSINWLRHASEEKEYLIEIIDIILGNKEIANSLFEAIYLYSTSVLSASKFRKDGSVEIVFSSIIASQDKLLKYALMDSIDDVLQLVKRLYSGKPNTFFQNKTEKEMQEIFHSHFKDLKTNLDKVAETNYMLMEQDLEE